MIDFTAAELRARIQKQAGMDVRDKDGTLNVRKYEEQQAARDILSQVEPARWPEDLRNELRDEQAEQDAREESRYSLRDEGRNDDGTGESYAERNA